jgi:hypothetical protein
MKYSYRMNSSVIFAMNPQLYTTLRSRNSSISASFKKSRVSSDSVCRSTANSVSSLAVLRWCQAWRRLQFSRCLRSQGRACPRSGPRCLGCRRSSLLSRWLWNGWMSVLTPANSSTCRPLLISRDLVGFLSGSHSCHVSVNRLLWDARSHHTVNVWIVQFCEGRSLTTIFSWRLR